MRTIRIKEEKYVSQEDAEFVAKLSNLLNQAYVPGISNEMKAVYDDIQKKRMEAWNVVFSPESPWKPAKGRRGQVEIEYKD